MGSEEEQCVWQCWKVRWEAKRSQRKNILEDLARKKTTSLEVNEISGGQKREETGESWNLFLLKQILSPPTAPTGHQVNTPDRTTDRSWQQGWCCLAMVRPSHIRAASACPVPEPQIQIILWGGTHQRLSNAAAPGQCWAPLSSRIYWSYMTLLWGKHFCNSRDAFMADLILPLKREISATADQKWFSLPNILLLLADEIFSLLKLHTQLLSCNICWTPENIWTFLKA